MDSMPFFIFDSFFATSISTVKAVGTVIGFTCYAHEVHALEEKDKT